MSARRPAKTLVLFILLLPVLLGWVGLTVDTGLLLAAHRQAQNAADAAALAAAKVRMQGQGTATALNTANTYVQQYNGLSGAPALVEGQTFNIPPTQGPYAGNAQYLEVIVTNPIRTWFIQFVGVAPNQSAQARAVAGFPDTTSGIGVAALNPNAIPGLSLSGSARLAVNGKLLINSHGGGYDQNNQPVNLGYGGDAVRTSGSATVQGTDVEVVGGVSAPSDIQNYQSGSGSPLHAGATPETDPLANLPTPTTENGVTATYWGYSNGQVQQFGSPQNVSISGGNVTLYPGIYGSIALSGNATVTLTPGIYVLAGGSSTTLSVSGSASLNGSGVMFYNTGSNYNAATGLPDAGDSGPPGTSSASFGGISLSGNGTLNLTAISDPNSPFNGMLFYQRRWNTKPFTISGNGKGKVSGTFYAPWANFNLSGNASYNAQFLVGSMSLSGQAHVTIDAAGQNVGKASQVFLVE